MGMQPDLLLCAGLPGYGFVTGVLVDVNSLGLFLPADQISNLLETTGIMGMQFDFRQGTNKYPICIAICIMLVNHIGGIPADRGVGGIIAAIPVDMNRQITGRITTHHFAPTPLAKQNLLDENVRPEQIVVTGNTVIDALYMVVEKIKNDANLQSELGELLKEAGYDTARLDGSRRLVLITGHRRENFGDGFISMCTAIRDLAAKYPDVDFVYPMHLNPNVRKPIHEVFGDIAPQTIHNTSNIIHSNLFFIEPLEYLSFVYLMEKSTIVLTDSGGIQEEAPGLGKPVLVMRDTTERPEALESGTVHLVGTNYEKIVGEVSTLLDDNEAYQRMSQAVNPYGDGLACGRIAGFLSNPLTR